MLDVPSWERISVFRWSESGATRTADPGPACHVGLVACQINLLETVLNMYSAHL